MLSHVDDQNRPRMVDVGAKAVTRRTAHAQARLVVPDAVAALFDGRDISAPKGPVFQTAIVAGVMAAKKTGELIPLCHPLGLDDCRIEIALTPQREIVIDCRVSIHHKTGVEMEALTGASVAALTVYDMCKAMSHDMVIKDIRLMSKTGGKHDYARAE